MTSTEEVAGVLKELHSLLTEEGGVLAEALRPAEDGRPEVFASLVAAGQRTRSDPRGYALVVEGILEGYLLHYRRGRIVEGTDPDLRLLAGDHLYAFGLVRLANIGDLEAVDELSDLISLCAQVHAAEASEAAGEPWQLTGALWASAVLAVADGPWPAHEEAKRAVRDEDAKVITKALDAARDRARELDLEPCLEHALIAFHQTVESELSAT